MTTFLTGVTGFLGQQLASALLAEGEDLVVLARGRSVIEANRRVQEALFARRNGSMSPRVHVCLGSLEAPGLGLGPGDRDLILSRCEDFIHCAANIRLDLPLRMARAVNVGGTRGVLALARERERRGGLRRLHHVSTAFVAGNRTDLVGENELDARTRTQELLRAKQVRKRDRGTARLRGAADHCLPAEHCRRQFLLGRDLELQRLLLAAENLRPRELAHLPGPREHAGRPRPR